MPLSAAPCTVALLFIMLCCLIAAGLLLGWWPVA